MIMIKNAEQKIQYETCRLNDKLYIKDLKFWTKALVSWSVIALLF